MKRIIFDCDDVLANCRDVLKDTVQVMVDEKFAAGTGPQMHVDWNDWVDFYALGTRYLLDFDEILNKMVERHDLERMKPEPYASVLTNWLHLKHYNITVVTARGYHPNAHAITSEWFKQHKIHADEIICVGSHESKRDVIQHLGDIKCYVEDNHHHLIKANELSNVERVYLVDRPWNRDCDVGERIMSLRKLFHFL